MVDKTNICLGRKFSHASHAGREFHNQITYHSTSHSETKLRDLLYPPGPDYIMLDMRISIPYV